LLDTNYTSLADHPPSRTPKKNYEYTRRKTSIIQAAGFICAFFIFEIKNKKSLVVRESRAGELSP
jgi:hypothetical protein